MSIGPWQPLWLDAQSRCLYAALHHEPSASTTAPGVVFVPPLLHEQPRSRRFLAEAASGLAALGIPCLRFDYSGTGDSAGAGDRLDFASMGGDLDLAIATLRARAGVDRVVLLAWRGAVLPLSSWLAQGRHADLVVLWEPIADGAHWLDELQQDDAAERAARPRPRPGVPRSGSKDDGQLMGFAAPPALRRDLAQSRLADQPQWRRVPVWSVARQPAPPLTFEVDRTISLPSGVPTFSGGASMEATFFLSPRLARVVDELGRTLLEHDFHRATVLEQDAR